MANPWLFFENVFEDADATFTVTNEASGFPKENVLDWFRWSYWKSSGTTAPIYLHVDMGVGNTAQPTTLVVGGHNLHTAGASVKVEHSDDDSAWTQVGTTQTPTTKQPVTDTFSPASAHRYWRVSLTGTLSVAPQIGIVTLGRRIDLPLGVAPGFDAFGHALVTDRVQNTNGETLGVNVRNLEYRWNLDYSDGRALSKSSFFSPVSGLTFDGDFVDHFHAGKPFWLTFNTDEYAHADLCELDGDRFTNSYAKTTARRNLGLPIRVLREL
jgi:hypothetical protein